MIAKNTTSAVNFLVLDLDGFPSTGQASNITATISINGATATAIADTITEKGAGWYYFNHAFNTAGNVFIEFSATNCTIMPWEDDVVEMASGSLTAQQVWEYSGGRTVTNTAQIALAVWSYEDENNLLHPYRTIYGIEAGNTIYQPYGPGHEQYLAESIWGLDPSIMLSSTSAAQRLIDIQNNAARPGAAMTLTAAYDAAKTASQFNASTDTVTINSTQAATMTTATGFATPANITSAQSAIIAAMPSTSGLATGSDVSSAQAAIIAAMPDVSGLSTFDPSNDTVTINATQAATMTTATGFATPADLAGLSTFNASTDAVTINSTQAATMVTATGFATPSDIPTADITTIKTKVDTLHNTDLTGIATSANVTASQNAVIAAMPTIPTDYAKASDLTGLSTFNAATDAVTIDSTQAASMVTATGFATPANITTAQAAIIAHGDENWVGGGEGGGATPKQIWEYSDRTLTAATLPNSASLATAANVDAAVTALETYGQTNWITATGFATPSDLTGLSTFDAVNDTVTIDSTQASTMVTATGFATPSDITTSQASIEAAIANIDIDTSDLATSAEVAVIAELQKDLNAGVLNWSVTANALTIYNDNNTVRGTYTLTRDTDGNITRILPNS